MKAAGLHLALSVVFMAAVVGPLITTLYPGEYFRLAGASGLITLMVAVDVALGPALTLCVFDPRKPSDVLRRDIATIVLLQMAALGFGVYSTMLARPVFLTFAVDRFELVSAAEVDAEELKRALPAFQKLSWSGPVVVGARRPDDALQRERLLLASTIGIDLRHLISRYMPYQEVQSDALARAKPVADLLRTNGTAEVARALAIDGAKAPQQLRWLPVVGKGQDHVAVIDAVDGKLLGVVPLMPW